MNRYLVQLSDPHIKAPGLLAYGRVDTAAYLARAVAAVNALPQPADAVVVTGDLTDFGRADEYAHLRMLLDGLRCPVYLMPGNHDDRAGLRAGFADHAYLQGACDLVQYAVDLGGLRLIAADTVVPGASHGSLLPDRIADLDRMLGEKPNLPSIVAMHHPPFRTLIGHMDEIGLCTGAEDLAAVIGRHPRVERVICGHLHRSIQVRWAGTIAMCAPSTAHQVALDLSINAPSAFVLEPPGFLVHAWDESGAVVTHLKPVGDFAGPFPFHQDGALID